jgi:hypothetical protein
MPCATLACTLVLSDMDGASAQVVALLEPWIDRERA